MYIAQLFYSYIYKVRLRIDFKFAKHVLDSLVSMIIHSIRRVASHNPPLPSYLFNCHNGVLYTH